MKTLNLIQNSFVEFYLSEKHLTYNLIFSFPSCCLFFGLISVFVLRSAIYAKCTLYITFVDREDLRLYLGATFAELLIISALVS